MLVARGQTAIGAAGMRWAFAFSRRAWIRLVEGQGLLFDSRFVPGAPGPPKPSVCLYLLVRGGWQALVPDGPRHGDRSAIAMMHEQLEGADHRRSFAFRATGEPFVCVELNFATADVRNLPPMPGALDLDDAAWAAALRAATLSENDDAILVQSLGVLLRRLAQLGFVTEDAAEKALTVGRPVERLWRAVKPMVERMTLAPTLEHMSAATGLSLPQVEREFQRLVGLFGLVGPGLRNVMLHLRLKVAVLLLSAEGVAVADVARTVGYGSADAMTRAFRVAGLPAPSVAQQQLLASRRAAAAAP
jgi:AraC-like DNA-binding protein